MLNLPFNTAFGPRLEDSYDTIISGDSLTKQSFKDDCDINNILKRFEKTGIIEHENRFKGDYGEFIDVLDYQTSLNQIIEANEMFSTLPSNVRARFANDPVEFLEYVGNPNNLEEMISMGLAKRKVESESEVSEDPAPLPT